MIQIACSDQHCLALTTDGRVFSRGANGCGQLGLGHCNPSAELQEVQLKMDSGSFRFANFVACGAHHSVVICETMFGFGNNSNYRFGARSPSNCVRTPEPIICSVRIVEPITKACCGVGHSLFLSTSGQIFGCGSGHGGQLGGKFYGKYCQSLTSLTLPAVVQGRVVDIFSHPDLCVSVLMNEQGTLYISGVAGELFGHDNHVAEFFPLKDKAVILRSRLVCIQPEFQSCQARFNDPFCCDIQVCTAEKSDPIFFGYRLARDI